MNTQTPQAARLLIGATTAMALAGAPATLWPAPDLKAASFSHHNLTQGVHDEHADPASRPPADRRHHRDGAGRGPRHAVAGTRSESRKFQPPQSDSRSSR